MKELPSQDELIKARMEGDEITAALMPKVPEPIRIRKFLRPMHIKECEQGKFKIKSTTNSTWQVASLRHAIFFGVKPLKVDFGAPVNFHNLIGPADEGGTPGILTSDQPQEIYSQYIEFRKCYGHVLVGGLGLGMAAQMIRNMPTVKSITVVEKNTDIIELIKDQIDPRIKVIHADLFEFLKQPQHFDSAYYDIWYGTGESTWVSHIVPLYRLSRKAGIKGALTAWGETEMYAQFIPSLYVNTKVQYDHPWQPYKVFHEGIKKKYGTSSTTKQIKLAIKLYLTKVGSPEWEKMFDWEKWKKDYDLPADTGSACLSA